MYKVKLVILMISVIFAAVFFARDNIFSSEASVLPASHSAAPLATPTPTPSTGGCLSPPTVSSSVPADMANVSQQDANCFAWQEFIALNWAANTTCSASSATASQFGQPNNTAPVVWETYKEAGEVFLPGAAAPTPWCSQQPVPLNLTKAKVSKLKPTSPHGFKVLMSDSKDDGNPNFSLADFQQAGDNSWLTAQKNSNKANYLALFEVRMNLDEFSYVNQNQLYNANVQQTFVQNPGINLPDGTAQFSKYGNTGSIELKAAWVQLDDPSQWPYFKTSQAYVVYPWAPGTPQLVTVGLVGLHIIHKTASDQQFVWATFEHVNNAPSTTDIANKTFLPWYTFYNQGCNASSDYYQCSQNASSAPQGYPACAVNAKNNPNNLPLCSQALWQSPIQAVRTTPISNLSTNNIAGLNSYAWGKIAAANPNSVFLNYRLVNVIWANNSTNIPAGAQAPLTAGDPQPPPAVQPVANTTLETYLQTNTCTSCHVFAAIAPANSSTLVKNANPVVLLKEVVANKLAANSPSYASDYSFLLGRATTPPPGKSKIKK